MATGCRSKIWRNHETLDLSLPVTIHEGDRVLGNQYDVLPRYYIYAGLVFTPLSQEYMKTLGRDFRALGHT